MYPRILWELLGSLFLFGLGVVGGYHLASTQCELEKLEFYNDALEKQAQADRKTQDMENVYKDALVNAQSGVVLDLERIKADFTGARFDFSSWSDRMRYNEAGADSTNNCPTLPQLPPQFQKRNADAVQRTAQSFKDFMNNSL